MERRLCTCSILAILAGVPASHLTSSDQWSPGVSTSASSHSSPRPRPAVITRGNGLQEDVGDMGSTAWMSAGHPGVNTFTSANTGPSESSSLRVRRDERVCHVTGFRWRLTDIVATTRTDTVLYFRPRRKFSGIYVYLHLRDVMEEWRISKEDLCITSTADWYELWLGAQAGSTNSDKWIMWATTDQCNVTLYHTTYWPETYLFVQLIVRSRGPSCWRYQPRPSNRTRDTTTTTTAVTHPPELTSLADDLFTTSTPSTDSPDSQVDQVAVVVVVVVVLVVLVVAALFIRCRMTSYTRAASPDEDTCCRRVSRMTRCNTRSAPPTPDSSQTSSELAQVFLDLPNSTYSTQEPTEMSPDYRVNVEPQSSQPSSSNGHIHEEMNVLRGFPESDIILVREAFASRRFRVIRN